MNTIDIAMGLVIVVILVFAGRKTWQKITGKASCCGGSKEKVQTKKIKNVIGKKIVQVEGMHCVSCKNSVLKGLQALEGVSAKVSVEKKSAIISYNREISDEEITTVIEKRGFKVVAIEKTEV